MRKCFFITIILSVILSFAGLVQAAPSVVLNGQTLTFDVPPVVENDRTLVPLRTIFEALGASVQWDDATQAVTATKDSTVIRLTIGGQAYKDGLPVNLDAPAKIINDRTVVPLRFVSESLGCQVNWDESTQTITISSSSGTSTVKVNFIDIGQADSIYISLPNHQDILIDGGNVADGQTVVNYLKSHGADNELELVIATHPHEDHIGGLLAVYDAFHVNETIDCGKDYTTDAYNNYFTASHTSDKWETDDYQTFTFGTVKLQILTGNDSWDDLNDYSVVCKLTDNNVNFLFTGDVEGSAEAALGGNLQAQILKVGHHGSTSSSSAEFLNNVKPQVAVISVGTGNTYGHPAARTVQGLNDAGAIIYRTDYNGNIVISTDGNTYSVETERSAPATQITPASQVQSQPQNQVQSATEPTTGAYVGSSKSNKYHLPTCRYAQKISPENRVWFQTKEEAQAAGYEPCAVCKP